MSKSFKDPSHEDFTQNAPFAVYMAWAQNFCEYAIKVLQAQDEQNTIDKL